jgi:hypothetical protein
MRPERICRRARVCHVIRRELWFLLRLVGCMWFCTFQAVMAPVFEVTPPVLARPWLFPGGGRTYPRIRFPWCHMGRFHIML